MIRLISAFLLMQLTATAALLPEALGEFERRTPGKQLEIPAGTLLEFRLQHSFTIKAAAARR